MVVGLLLLVAGSLLACADSGSDALVPPNTAASQTASSQCDETNAYGAGVVAGEGEHCESRLANETTPSPAATAAYSASGCLKMNGLAYGPFRDGQSPSNGVFPTEAQIEEDLRFIRELTANIRVYGCTGTLALIPELARDLDMQVMLGIPLSEDTEANEAEIQSAIDLAERGLVDWLIVGNENLTLGALSKDELVPYIRRVREAVPEDIPVSTAEFWSEWYENPDLADEVDFIVAHFYPFWEGHPVDGAAETVVEQYNQLKEKLESGYPGRSIRIVIGETGWPSGGTPEQAGRPENVVPSGPNQRKYTEEFVRLADENSIEFYLFAAFDEEWKWGEGVVARLRGMDCPMIEHSVAGGLAPVGVSSTPIS